jgi:LytS/YehU family sensor histidine kinase
MIYLRSNIYALQNDNLIPFGKELGHIKAYLNIERMRYPGLLDIEYDLKSTNFYVAPLSIEPLVENAAEHGILPRYPTGGKITIRSYETEAEYCVEVVDDGVGFDTDRILEDTQVGLKNIKYRLEKLMDARVQIASSIGNGTKVTLAIPKQGGTEKNKASQDG